MTDQSAELLVRLDRIIAILELAFHDQIEDAKAQIRRDPINAAVLDEAVEDWVQSGDLQRRVAQITGAAPRTIRVRLQALLAQQVVQVRGAGTGTEYRSTGLL